MTAYLLPGMMGLLTGLMLHWARFSRPGGLRDALALRRRIPTRSGLTALGWGAVLCALLTWLAVIDVDTIRVLPLSAGTLGGGLVFGVCAGLCGFTPVTACASLTASPVEALCTLAGCVLGTALLPYLPSLPAGEALSLPLKEQACAGLLLATVGLCIPCKAGGTVPPESPVRTAEPPPPPADAPAETFVALLEGEEALVIDTGLDEAAESPPTDTPDESSSGEEASNAENSPNDEN